MTNKTIISRLRKIKRCGKNPTVFEFSDGGIGVSAEDGGDFADYYGEFRGGYQWICPELENFVKSLGKGYYWEWENPGCLRLSQ